MTALALQGGKPAFTAKLESYPRPLGGELAELEKVLAGGKWNVGYGDGPTRQLEEEWAAYIGTRYAVAVNTGGMALQMALRALGVEPGEEVICQVDTCVANAFAVMSAQATPIFADSDPQTFMLNRSSLEAWITPRTKILMPVHLWGRPEDMDMVAEVARKHNLTILEDACLAAGAEWRGQKVGRFGKIACFSFGCLKSLQTGEGGVIVTDDEHLYKELQMLRPYGDMAGPYKVRDQRELAWNGRPSQFVSAVALAQLRRFGPYLEALNDGAGRLRDELRGLPGIIPMPDDSRITRQAYTQFMFKIDEEALGCSREAFAAAIAAEGIPFVWHGAFEPINGLSFFTSGRWRTWLCNHRDPEFVARNYARRFEAAENNFNHVGMSFSRDILVAPREIQDQAVSAIRKVCENARALKDWASSPDSRPSLKIRPLSAKDADGLFNFYRTLSEAATAMFQPFGRPFPAWSDVETHLKETEAGKHISLGLVRADGTVEGHGLVFLVDADRPIFGIGLQNRVQGQGWGRKLMEAVLAEARRRELPLVTLTHVKTNSRARALYESLGFVKKGEATFRDANDSDYMELVWRKECT